MSDPKPAAIIHSTDARANRLSRAASRIALLCCLAIGALSGCSITSIAIDSIGDGIAESSTVYAGDDDIELVGAATPFALKTIESLLEKSPRHRGLLLAAARGFTQYAYAFVELPADEIEDSDVAAAYAGRDRARRLYLRARDYGLRGLEVRYPGMTAALAADPGAALAASGKDDVALLYWTALAWGAAISVSKDDPYLVAGLPTVAALMQRALVLDEDFGAGAIHVFLISFEMSRAGLVADAETRARAHFVRAVELSGGAQAAPYVVLAESVEVARHDRSAFDEALREALAVDADTPNEWRLANRIMQRRAVWLASRTDLLFVD